MNDLMCRLGYEALLMGLPLLLASYGVSFLLVVIRNWAFAEGHKLRTQRAFLLGGLLVVLISGYVRWIVVCAGLLVADFHRVLGVG